MRVTLRDVARRAGFSASTVSQVLNNRPSCFASEQTRQKILAAAKELGYRPALCSRVALNGRPSLIGIAAPYHADYPQVEQIRSLRRALRRSSYVPTLAYFAEDGHDLDEALEGLAASGVAGLILMPSGPLRDPPRRALSGCPVVAVTAAPLPDTPTLQVDEAAAVGRMVRSLAEGGHVRLAFVTAHPARHEQKIRGFREAMESLGNEPVVLALPRGCVSANRIARRLGARLGEMTALLADSDRLAAELMDSLEGMGRRVPEDCSVVGFGDKPIARLITPQLTTLRPPREEVGKQAVEMLSDCVAGRSVEGRVLVPEVVERDSTAGCLQLSRT